MKNKSFLKRMSSGFLALVMAVSLVPANVAAADISAAPETIVETSEAESTEAAEEDVQTPELPEEEVQEEESTPAEEEAGDTADSEEEADAEEEEEESQEEGEDEASEETTEELAEETADETESEESEEEEVAEPHEYAAAEAVSLNGSWERTSLEDASKTVKVTVPDSWEYYIPNAYSPMMLMKTLVYTREVDVSEYAGRRLTLKFEGVNKKAVVSIDDVEIGTHIGGFTTFYMDITDACEGKDKVTLKVAVTNIEGNTMPVNTDFTHFAGIYRDAYLLVSDEAAQISHDDFGSDGVYFNTKVDAAKKSVVIVPDVVVDYQDVDPETDDVLKIETIIKDASGKVVGTATKEMSLEGKEDGKKITLPAINISNAHLWQGTVDPYQYTASAAVYVNDVQLDSFEDQIGFRTYEVKNGKFYLNGSEYELRGVGMHQEWNESTNATTKAQKRQDIANVLEMGANALRTCHYPHDQYTYDLCDEKGIVVWSEIPFYLLLIDSDAFKQNAKDNLAEMILQGINHSSIIMWGIENEVNYYANYANFYKQLDGVGLGEFMKELARYAHELDPSRLVGEAEIDNTDMSKETANWTTPDSGIDVVGFNIYTGWYSNVNGATEENKINRIVTSIKNKLKTYQERFDAVSGGNASFIMTEYGAGANIEHHDDLGSDFIWWGSDASHDTGYYTTGSYHPEEYQSYVHEGMIMALYGDETNEIEPVENVWCKFAWSLYDFSCYRNEGGTTRRNTKGLITSDRATKKDAFYLYKANWNDSDYFVHITSSRFTDRETPDTDVKVYSNCDKVELTVNGQSYGEGKKTQDGVFVWNKIPLIAKNEIVATGYHGSATCTDTVDGWTTTNPGVPVLNGLIKAMDKQWYYYVDGQVDTTYTGMAKNEYGWWYVTNGKLDRTYTGMAKNEYGWWYMTNGKLDTTYTGMAKNAYGWWYMTNGKLDTTYTGMAKNAYGWWYMTNGKLDTTYTGMAKNAYGWWYMTKGKLDTTYTGMAKNAYGWWYMTNGKLNSTYTGIGQNQYGKFYFKSGKIYTGHAGKVTVGGKTYTIDAKGKVIA